MRLIYEKTGKPVRRGDVVRLDEGWCYVENFNEPHKPSSSGKVSIMDGDTGEVFDRYVSVIRAKWIEREDLDQGGAQTQK
jgi:DNA-binding beta-propeller fold protein YncE